MNQPSPANSSPQGPRSADAPVTEPGFEVRVQDFWEKNRKGILLVCAAALLVIVGREGWQYFSAMREKGVRDEYARIADQSDKLAGFATANSGHALAGVAQLRLADEKFSAGDYKQAATGYQQAAASLRNEILLGRAKLGAAMSRLKSGDQAAGEAALKALMADQALLKGVRAEAAYHLASLAAEAGRADEAKKLVDEVGKIDTTGAWFQRATMLLATFETGDKPAEAGTPAITFKSGGN